MKQDIDAIRRWHAAIGKTGSRLISFEGRQVNYLHDIGVLLARIAVLERDNSTMSKAPTDADLPVPGGPCEPHYIKGWNDALRNAVPVVRTVFNQARIRGRDILAAETSVVEALRTCKRTQARPPTTLPDIWDGAS